MSQGTNAKELDEAIKRVAAFIKGISPVTVGIHVSGKGAEVHHLRIDDLIELLEAARRMK